MGQKKRRMNDYEQSNGTQQHKGNQQTNRSTSEGGGGVGILLNKKWKQRIIDSEYINERAISTTIVVNRQRIKLMNVYFIHPLGICGPH